MKSLHLVAAVAVAFAACDNSPKVDPKNATGNQVAQAVHKSGVLTGDTMVEPGLWESRVTINKMNIPGMPPEYASKMKAMMAERQHETTKHCLTKEDVKKPKEGFFAGEDKSCHYAHFAMGGGKIDIQMVCNREGQNQTTNMAKLHANKL